MKSNDASTKMNGSAGVHEDFCSLSPPTTIAMTDMEETIPMQPNHSVEDEEDEYLTDNDGPVPGTGSRKGANRAVQEQEDDEPGQASPTTSSAMSVSSVPPTLVSALLQRHEGAAGSQFPFELTPVMCNTSSGNYRRQANSDMKANSTKGAAISTTSAHRKRPSVVSPLDVKEPQELGPNMNPHLSNGDGFTTSSSHFETPSMVVCEEDAEVAGNGSILILGGGDKEHLSLPNDLADDEDSSSRSRGIGSRASSSSGSLLPPIRLTSGSRSQSLTAQSLTGIPNGPSIQEAMLTSTPSFTHADSPSKAVRHHSFLSRHSSEMEMLRNPISFPTHKKFNSFTNRQQYKDSSATQHHVEFADTSEGHYPQDMHEQDNVLGLRHRPQHHGLTPYQPTRPEDAMLEVPPEEELSQIFAARARFLETRSASDQSLSEKHHRLAPANLYPSNMNGDEGQARIGPPQPQGLEHFPSLHLAHRLSAATTMTDNNSVTTHTTLNTWGEDEDEEDLLLPGSNQAPWLASWQQHAAPVPSGPPLLEDPQAEVNGSPHRHRRQSSETPSVVVEGLVGNDLPWVQQTPRRRQHGASTTQQLSQAGNSSWLSSGEESLSHMMDSNHHAQDSDTIMAVDGRHVKEQEALEWIQSLQASSQDTTKIAEAASSKFLCGTTGSPMPSPDRRNRPTTTVGTTTTLPPGSSSRAVKQQPLVS